MAKGRKLKVFRTPIGFHDAFVSASSQKAALAAWGSDANLFARGIAEEVKDPALMEEPLAHPGTVIKRSRGTAAEQFAALPPEEPAPRRKAVKSGGKRTGRRAAQSRAVPSRAELDLADKRPESLASIHQQQRAELSLREAQLARERKALHIKQDGEQAAARQAHRNAQVSYAEALRRWKRA